VFWGNQAFFEIGLSVNPPADYYSPDFDNSTSIQYQTQDLRHCRHSESNLGYWMFQLVFAMTSCMIVSGAVAERVKWPGYVIYCVLFSTILYPPVVRCKSRLTTLPDSALQHCGTIPDF
jgi:ammonia channel protein AmtB